jgi:hypothetical protein
VLGRGGAVWGDRFHARDLKTPREVRHALVYVLNNHRKHGVDRDRRVDRAPRRGGSRDGR